MSAEGDCQAAAAAAPAAAAALGEAVTSPPTPTTGAAPSVPPPPSTGGGAVPRASAPEACRWTLLPARPRGLQGGRAGRASGLPEQDTCRSGGLA